MKNMIFGFAFMLIGTFAFANEGSQIEEKTIKYDTVAGICYVTIYQVNNQGQIVGQSNYTFENVDSQTECDRLKRLMKYFLS